MDLDPDPGQNLDADPDPDPDPDPGGGEGVGQPKMCIPPGKILGTPLPVPIPSSEAKCFSLKLQHHLVGLLAVWKQIANGAHRSVSGLLYTKYSCWQRLNEHIWNLFAKAQ